MQNMKVRATFLKDNGEEYNMIYQHETTSEAQAIKAVAMLMEERSIPHSQLLRITIEFSD